MIIEIIIEHLPGWGRHQALGIRKGPHNKGVQPGGPSSLCHSYSAPVWPQESSYRHCVNEWMWLPWFVLSWSQRVLLLKLVSGQAAFGTTDPRGPLRICPFITTQYDSYAP